MISEKHPSTDAAYGSSLVDVTILIHSKIYHPTIESKKAKPIVVVYWICLCEQEPSPASMAPVSEAGESSKAYKRSHKETINQIPNHHTWSFTGRVGPQARLGSPSSALPARPPSSPSPTEAISSTSHASYGKFNQHDEVLSKDFERASESNRSVYEGQILASLKKMHML